jgi:endonuclease/exonuclease/phosphatase family metal-dependent hydrolase
VGWNMRPRTGPDPSRRCGRGPARRLVHTALVAAAAAVLTSSVPAVPAPAGTTFVVLQMNLCNSGLAIAPCYSLGKAVDEAVAAIHRYPPDLVTLQEVCRDDMYARNGRGKLAQAMADLYGNDRVSVEFVHARNRDTNDGYRCANGDLYGVAVMHHGDGRDVHHGWYSSQDASNEIRAWTCTAVIEGRLTGCTTHLSTDPEVAVRQCHELMSILASPWVTPKVIVAGDFNLTFEPGRAYNAQNCALAAYDRRSDHALQQMFTRNIEWVQGGYEAMRWTDHPLLYERFRV